LDALGSCDVIVGGSVYSMYIGITTNMYSA
jgi:hypothetical protein